MGKFEKSINKQRSYIEDFLIDRLAPIAGICAQNWGIRVLLDQALKSYLDQNKAHRCSLLYVIDKEGRQFSSNISSVIVDEAIVGQDLSNRPYLEVLNTGERKTFLLSDVYIDKQSRKPCITALHSIVTNGNFLGYIAADFDLKDLPLKNVDDKALLVWRQIKGDPSIRGTLFQQTRTASAMDEHLEEVLDVIESLITEQGIFHAKLHFSSSRATLWPYDDPYHYRIHVLDEIIDPKVCLVYARKNYYADATIPADMVSKVFKVFKALRESDETIYLRAASLNVMNGLVGLNFSCDGSHYMPAQEFLNKDLKFWFGSENENICQL